MSKSAFLPARKPLAAALALALLGLNPQAALAAEGPAAQQQLRSYQIPAGPLAVVLNRFAADAGVLLAFDSALLARLESPGLQGSYTVEGGFARLLAGTGLQWQAQGEGSYTLRAALPTLSEGERSAPSLPALQVLASQIGTPEQLGPVLINNLAASNGDLGSLLRINPNVQFDEGALSSDTGGEIAPAEISIHGSKPYQNGLLINGMSIANEIDPGYKSSSTSDTLVPGNAQAYAVDASLLCNISVLDSNISAEYGGFTGGVVSAETCAARAKLAGHLAVGYTSSGWTELHVDPRRQADFDASTDEALQPEYRKWTYKAGAEMRSDAGWGLVANLVRRTSAIPLNMFDDNYQGSSAGSRRTQRRTADTVMLKADWAFNPQHSADLSLLYAPTEGDYFHANRLNGDFHIKTGGLSASGRLQSQLDALKLTQLLTVASNEQSRNSDADYRKAWNWSEEKNWGDNSSSNATSIEGAFGDVRQKSDSLNYKLKAEWAAMQTGPIAHRLISGVDLTAQRAAYVRDSEVKSFLTPATIGTSGNLSQCLDVNGVLETEGCSLSPVVRSSATWPGQYFKRLITYAKGRFDVSSNQVGAYVEDSMSWGNWLLRLGARADQDGLSDDSLNLAPRSSLSWQTSPTLALNLGANRYYGRSLFAYSIQEKILTLQSTRTRSGNLTWSEPAAYKPANRLEDIKTPYDDEFTVGSSWSPEALNGALDLRYTHRSGRDQIVKRTLTGQSDCNSNQCIIYTNAGRSTTEDLTLSWSQQRPWQLGQSETHAWLAFNYSDVRSNATGYTDSLTSAELGNEIIQYDGEFIRYDERPADNYNRPWTLRLGAVTRLPAWQLTFTPQLRIRDGYTQIVDTGETTDYQGQSVDVWRATRLPRAITLDLTTSWEPRIGQRQSLLIKLVVENLTSRKNQTTVSDSYVSYERGRSAYLEAGYRF